MESRRIHLSQGLSQDAVRNGKCATIDSPSPQPHCKDLRPCAISIPRLCCLFFFAAPQWALTFWRIDAEACT